MSQTITSHQQSISKPKSKAQLVREHYDQQLRTLFPYIYNLEFDHSKKNFSQVMKILDSHLDRLKNARQDEATVVIKEILIELIEDIPNYISELEEESNKLEYSTKPIDDIEVNNIQPDQNGLTDQSVESERNKIEFRLTKLKEKLRGIDFQYYNNRDKIQNLLDFFGCLYKKTRDLLEKYDFIFSGFSLLEIKKMHEKYRRLNSHREKIQTRFEETQKSIKKQKEKILEELEYLTQAEEKTEKEFEEEVKKYQSFFDRYALMLDGVKKATSLEESMRVHHQAEKDYFDSTKSYSFLARNAAISFIKHRISEKHSGWKMTNVFTARDIITAERFTIQASIRRTDGVIIDKKYGWKGNPHAPLKLIKDYTFNEIIQLNNWQFVYNHRIHDCKDEHLGDYYMQSISDYKKIYQERFAVYTGKKEESEKSLSKLMLKFARTGETVSSSEAKKLNPDYHFPDSEVEQMYRIFYHCIIKENSRHLTSEGDNLGNFPLAIAQGRALKLIEAGSLRLEQVFDQYSGYGVFTGKRLSQDKESIRKKVIDIFVKYEEEILNIERLKHEDQILEIKRIDEVLHKFVLPHEKLGTILNSKYSIEKELSDIYSN